VEIRDYRKNKLHNISRKERKEIKHAKQTQKKMTENEISYKIIGVAIELHKSLGPGLLESAYETPFAYELRETGLNVEEQVPMPLIYKDIKMDCGYRIDLLVEKKVIVEIKSLENLAPVHYAQVLTYLRLSKCKLGLLINFNTVALKDGIHRIVNNL
jgi:GxxExxY protein